MNRIAIILLCLLILLPVAGGARVYGVVYSWETLEPLPRAIVTVNSTPVQRMVTGDGHYSFNLTPGSYLIEGFYYRKGELQLYDREVIVIKDNGDYVVDLILFPPLPDLPEEPNLEFSVGKQTSHVYLYITGAAGIILVGTAVLLRLRMRGRGDEELPEDLKEVVSMIRGEGGRITQKELRKRLGVSEAKASLIVADLERRGIVEKVKRGRGNIIFLREKR